MLYTSGTTGRPKGVPRSHRAERAAALAQLVQLELRPGDRTLGVMPLYHTMGMRSLLAASACGGLFCSQPEFRAEAALDAVERERLTSLYLAPTLFHDLVAAQRERPRDVSSVRALAYAGAPMAAVLVERCVEAFAPQAFVNHYGSTEIYTFTIHGDQRAKPGCAGRAALNARIRLVEPVEGASPDRRRRAGRGRAGGLRALERRGLRRLLAAARCRRAADQGRLVLPGRSRPARCRRRPLPRRPHRRHDRLGRRERAPARDRGVARAPSRPWTRRPSWARRTSASASASWPTSCAPERSRRMRSTLTASPRRRSPASSGRATTVSSTRCRRARRASSCAACCARPRELT